MNIGLGVEQNYIEQLKDWTPGDSAVPSVLPRIPTGPTGVMTTAPSVLPLVPQASTFAKYLPYVLLAGVAITLFMLWQRSRAEGY